ncbi:MAG: universal stress protein [Bacteroidota bacterium]|nr:universal stress protein [Bacteroidota bacterium]
MKNILVPTDFSNLANSALDLAAAIAEKNNSQIFLMNVIEYPASPTFNVMGINAINSIDNIYIVEIIERIKDQLEKIKNEEKYRNITITTDVKIGSAFRSITEDIERHNVELVVMGTRGLGGLEGTLIGSNTEKVVRLAKCPVLTIKKSIFPEAIKEIVFATNLTEDQEDLIIELKKLQKLFKARIHIVKINTPNHFEPDRNIRKQLQDFVQKYNLEDYTLNIYSHTHEEDGIIYFADDINADLIALGTHGRTGVMHLLSGSIAEDVVNHASRPVWTYRLKK